MSERLLFRLPLVVTDFMMYLRIMMVSVTVYVSVMLSTIRACVVFTLVV